ncbi:MAG: RES family NAD+ phosphorylase [Ramlibacter sp.]|nr:RES family NAD+ phosphorylase [Ramlibacter sp.]
MKITELQYAPVLSLSAPTVLHRVQRLKARSGGAAIGPLRVPPPGLLLNRFDLPNVSVGYFAETPEAAVYEALARREALVLSLSLLRKRVILTLSTMETLLLLDLRPHAAAWPVLQSLRYGVTQQLALDAHRNGYAGIVYRSAQQYGADCYAVFGDALRGFRQLSRAPLAKADADAVHRAVAAALRGSKIPLIP